jgi:hypothetical protein
MMTTVAIPKLSLPGNLLVLGVNVLIVRWAWKRGGAWKILAGLNAFSAAYTVSQIATQL